MSKKHLKVFAAQAIALIDLLIAFSMIGVASFQFAKGATLLAGVTGARSEKLIRLVFYAAIIYIFLMVQIIMSIKLYRSAGKIIERPIFAIKVFGRWKEWSIIYIMAMILHAIVVLMLMGDGQRKQICLVCFLGHSAIRPFGIILINNFKKSLENHLPVQLSTKSLPSQQTNF